MLSFFLILAEGRVQDAIKASQLCLRLLETSVRDELRILLTFMATAAHPDACRLQKQVIIDLSLFCRLLCFPQKTKKPHCLSKQYSIYYFFISD